MVYAAAHSLKLNLITRRPAEQDLINLLMTLPTIISRNDKSAFVWLFRLCNKGD
jgi:hypothetical protein